MKCRFTLILLWPQNNQRLSFQNISKKWKKNEEKWLDKDITGTKPNLLLKSDFHTLLVFPNDTCFTCECEYERFTSTLLNQGFHFTLHGR